MKIRDRINNYLGNGGLWNPEAMEHEKVRDLLLDCRENIVELENALGCAISQDPSNWQEICHKALGKGKL